jgi:hypothetical protein
VRRTSRELPGWLAPPPIRRSGPPAGKPAENCERKATGENQGFSHRAET